MRVRMIKTAADNTGVYAAGSEYELDPAIAQVWVSRGAAVALDTVEEAVAEPVVEQSTRRRRKT